MTSSTLTSSTWSSSLQHTSHKTLGCHRGTARRSDSVETLSAAAQLYEKCQLKRLEISETGTERVQALADISRSALCCHSNETRTPTANPPNSAQLEATPTIHPTYIRVRAVVWKCGERKTNTQTYRHTEGRDHYTFRLGYGLREM